MPDDALAFLMSFPQPSTPPLSVRHQAAIYTRPCTAEQSTHSARCSILSVLSRAPFSAIITCMPAELSSGPVPHEATASSFSAQSRPSPTHVGVICQVNYAKTLR